MSAEIRDDALDAARYRYVRKLYWFERELTWRFKCEAARSLGELDAAIDRVIASRKASKQSESDS